MLERCNVKTRVNTRVKSIGTQTVNIERNEVSVQYDQQDIVETCCNEPLIEDDLSENKGDAGDKEYDPIEDASQRVTDDSVQDRSQQTFLIYEKQLFALFTHCCHCHLPISGMRKIVIGTFIRIEQNCVYYFYKHIWDSQPFGNLMLFSSILLAGAIPKQALRIFTFINCATITSRTYCNHQPSLLLPAINEIWSGYQFNLIQQLLAPKKPLVIGGDGRADSPGHLAKYGSYTLMELKHKAMLQVQLVQTWEGETDSSRDPAEGNSRKGMTGSSPATQYMNTEKKRKKSQVEEARQCVESV
uniref:Uncharacterized protein n=2 Tax=Amphimedon queenslandica TaxID=400682 RepID=A0A1X7U002_AMPQE